MECILDHYTPALKESINDLSILTLLYEVNREIFDTFEQPNPSRLKFTFKNTGCLPTEHFFVDLTVHKENNDRGDVLCTLTNSTDEINNIQFRSFNIYVNYTDDDKMILKIDYKLNETMYARVVLRTLDRIMNTIVTRLISFINEIPNTQSI